MSLNAFHKLFIAASILCLAFIAFWASGHNAGLVVVPWLQGVALAGAAALGAYLAWRVKRA